MARVHACLCVQGPEADAGAHLSQKVSGEPRMPGPEGAGPFGSACAGVGHVSRPTWPSCWGPRTPPLAAEHAFSVPCWAPSLGGRAWNGSPLGVAPSGFSPTEAWSPFRREGVEGEPISSEHFHRAVNVNDEDLLVRILQGGHVKVDVPNKFGFTALMVAAQKGYIRLVKILIGNGTDVNMKNGSGKDSLMLACYAGHLDVVKYLRAHGASWDARDLGGCTALHWAADGGHSNIIEWMIKDGCQIDALDTGSGWTPLMRVSAVSGNKEVASLLIEAGADVNMKDKDGKTPLMVAVLNNHEELVQLLLEKGADPSVKNEFGKGVLEMARVFDRQNVIALLEDQKRILSLKKTSYLS